MLKIYGSDLSGPANKIRFTANFLNLPYEYIRINLREGEQKQEWFLKLNPVGKVPVIDDEGFVLFESGAIIKYLAVKNSSALYPSELKTRATIDQWIDFINLHINAMVSKVVYNRVFAPIRKFPVDANAIKEGVEFLVKYLPILDAQLSLHSFVAGKDFSLADISLLAALDPAEIAAIDLAAYSHLIIWRNNLKQKEFYTKCHKEYGEMLKKPTGAGA